MDQVDLGGGLADGDGLIVDGADGGRGDGTQEGRHRDAGLQKGHHKLVDGAVDGQARQSHHRAAHVQDGWSRVGDFVRPREIGRPEPKTAT